MDWETINESIEHLAQPEYLYIGGAALALALILILLKRRQPRNVTAYSTTNGQVMVSRSAIVELVQTSCEQIKEVTKPQVRVHVKGRQTNFQVRLKLASGGQLRKIEETLQSHLRKALTENLGIENLGRIDIVATGFKSGRIEQTSSIPHKPADSEDSIYGDDEDDFDDDPDDKKDASSQP